MNTYGVLGLYIPAFGRIVGRMQYDLFHAYTVDAHTLFVVENSAALCAAALRQRVPFVQHRHAAARETRSRVSCGTVPRHRQRPRRRPFGARLRRCRSVLPRARHEPLRRATGRLARAAALAAVADGAEERHQRPERRQRVRAHGRRPDAPRLPLCADRRRRARHESQDLELVEGVAVRRSLPLDAPRAAPRRVSNPIDKDEFITGRQTQAQKLLSQAGLERTSYQPRLEQLHRGVFPAPPARGDRVAHARARRQPEPRRDHRRRQRRRRARLDGGRRVFAGRDSLVRSRDGGARRARTHDRRRAHRAARKVESRHLLRARERRQRDRRHAGGSTRSVTACSRRLRRATTRR